MKHILSIISTLLLVTVVQLNAQQNPSRNVDKKKQPTNQPTGNPGDPRNAEAGRDNANSSNQNANQSNDQQDENDGALLGEDNNDDNPSPDNTGNSNDNYRNNRVSGNPNNRETDGGSNREGSSQYRNNESSVADDSDSTSAGNAGQVQQNTGSGVLIDHSTSGSGSPAMKQEGDERDGTNNVQRAKPNMAGARVEGIRGAKRQADSDQEIRNGSQRAQKSPGNEVSRSKSAGQQGERMREQHSNSPQHQAAESEQVVTDPVPTTATPEAEVAGEEKKAGEKKKDKISRRKKRQSKD